MKLRTLTTAACVAALALSAAACGTIPKPTPEPISVTVKSLADAGCTFNFNFGVGGATGQLGGGAHIENNVSGGCNPALVHAPTVGAAIGKAMAPSTPSTP